MNAAKLEVSPILECGLVLATDGIRAGFAEQIPTDCSSQETAEFILARYGKDSDDALVLVARYSGGAP